LPQLPLISRIVRSAINTSALTSLLSALTSLSYCPAVRLRVAFPARWFRTVGWILVHRAHHHVLLLCDYNKSNPTKQCIYNNTQ
jgi:hypothetical protein